MIRNIVVFTMFLSFALAITPTISLYTDINPLHTIVITLILLLFFYNELLSQKSVRIMLLYFFLLFLFMIFKYNLTNYAEIINYIYILVLPIVFIEFFSKSVKKKELKYFIIIAIAIIIIRCILGISIELMAPLISRQLSSGLLMSQDSSYFNKIGIATYPFVNGLPFLILPFIFIIKYHYSKSIKLIFTSLSIIIFYTIFITSWGTALLIFIILSFYGFSFREQTSSNKRIISPIILIAIVISAFEIFSLDIFRLFESFLYNNQVLYNKILDIKASYYGRETMGQLQTRYELYLISINTFVINPVIGVSHGDIGGHSFILDHFAKFGLIGTLPFLYTIYLLFKKSQDILPKQYKTPHLVNMIVFVVFASLKNVFGFEFLLFLFVVGPFLILYFLGDLFGNSNIKLIS